MHRKQINNSVRQLESSMKRIEDMNREEMTKTENQGDFLFLHSAFSIPDVCANFTYSVSNIRIKIQESCILLQKEWNFVRIGGKNQSNSQIITIRDLYDCERGH